MNINEVISELERIQGELTPEQQEMPCELSVHREDASISFDETSDWSDSENTYSYIYII